ncbi:MAG: Uma2 family endonuclease [Pseudanabaena sp. Salubria-1]|jgi:Uma2 family endonuclease|nr:Uma2 family endonuclease [Pseudanabaena sp. Salubria-1]
MIATPVKTLTLDAFLQLPETEPASEYINNRITQKIMPKGKHSFLQYEICNVVNQLTKAKKIAYAFPELRCTFDGRSIVPDIAVFEWQNIPFLADGEIPDNFNIAPDWIIEVLSPDQNASQVIGKILHSLQNGSKLGWFIDPGDRSILTFQPNQQPVLMTNSDRLPSLEIISLELTVEALFSWLKMEN